MAVYLNHLKKLAGNIEHSAPPTRTISWCRLSRLLPLAVEPSQLLPQESGTLFPMTSFPLNRCQPSNDSWNDICSANRFWAFVTDILHLQWTLQWLRHLGHSKNTLIDRPLQCYCIWLVDVTSRKVPFDVVHSTRSEVRWVVTFSDLISFV